RRARRWLARAARAHAHGRRPGGVRAVRAAEAQGGADAAAQRARPRARGAEAARPAGAGSGRARPRAAARGPGAPRRPSTGHRARRGRAPMRYETRLPVVAPRWRMWAVAAGLSLALVVLALKAAHLQ